MKQKIEKLFDEFLNGVNSPFTKIEFRDENSYIKKRINKATVSRGNIGYLRQEVMRIINNAPFQNYKSDDSSYNLGGKQNEK